MDSSGQDLAKSINRLDFNIAYACNLSCKGCISLSDFDRRGVESLESIHQQCSDWKDKINPRVITLFGGEPLLHPRINQVIALVRKTWSGATIRLITNGYLLKRHDPSVWFDYEPFEIQVSVHRKDHEKLLTQEIKRILVCRDDWTITRSQGDGHKDIEFNRPGFKIYKSLFRDFVKPYRDDVTPFKSDPALAHSVCGSPNTPVLYKNRLYKCPPVANILDIIPGYVDYTSYGAEDDIADFVENIGKPHSVCAMCPENASHSVDHFAKENVHVKNID